MMLVLSVVPILAPAVGGMAMSFTDWRGLFVGLAFTGCLLFAVVLVSLAESHRPTTATRVGQSPFAPMAQLLQSPRFMLPAVLSGAGFGVMFSYIGESAFLFRDHFGLAPLPYGVLFDVNAAALIVGFQLGPLLERRHGIRRTLLVASSIGAAGALIMILAAQAAPDAVGPVVVALMLVLCGSGILNPVATAAAIDSYPGEVGATSGLSGALQFLMGGTIGTLPALIPFGTGAAALGLVCLACLLLALVGATRLSDSDVDDDVGIPVPDSCNA